MAEPSKKSPGMERALDKLGVDLLGGIPRTKAIRDDVCAACKGPAKLFRSALSRKEYTISGMCQKCQDSVFGTDPE